MKAFKKWYVNGGVFFIMMAIPVIIVKGHELFQIIF